MPVLDYPRLSITVDFGNGPVTGVFELYGGEAGRASVGEGLQDTQAVDNGLNNILGLLAQLTGDGTGGDIGARTGLNIDVGGGVHAWQISAQIPVGTTKADGTPVQWGSSDTVTDPATATSATGASATEMRNVINRYFDVGTVDSGNPATLEEGMYTSDSDTPYEPLSVVPKPQPTSFEVSGGETRLNVSLLVTKTVDGTEAVEAAERTKGGAGL